MTRIIQATLWTAYIVLPARVGGFIHGAPLGAIDTWALTAVIWLVARRRTIGGGRIVATVAVITAIVAAVVPERGFRARYFADAEARGPVEISTEYKSSAITRIDERLDFSPRRLDFPLAFINDIGRFNFQGPNQPERQRLPFAVSWDGQWLVTRGRSTTVYIDAPGGASAALVLDATRVASADPGHGNGTAVVELSPGWHRLDIRFSSPYGSPRRFSAGEIVDGRPIPFDSTVVVSRRWETWQVWLERVSRWLRIVCDMCAIAWLAILVALDLRDLYRGRRVDGTVLSLRQRFLAWFGVVAIVDAYLFAAPWFTQLAVLAAGDDPLTYESYARNIQLEGPLLKIVDGPFYYQVFYPYVLALNHTLFGEGMFGLMFVQRLLVAFVVWMVVRIAVTIGGEAVWPAAFTAVVAVAYGKFAGWVAAPATESVFNPLLVAWIAALVHVARWPSARRVAGTGLLGGFAALTRSTALLGWLAVLPACWAAWKADARRWLFVGGLLAASAAVFSFIAVRNAIVVHQFVPAPTDGPINLLGGNEPPPGLTLDFSRRGPLYDRLGVSQPTRQVAEYAITAPGTFARNLGGKALFALGFYELYAPGWGYSFLFIGITLAGIVGFALALRAAAAPASIVCIPALVAISQFAAVVLVYPKSERLILPFHIVMSAYAGIALERVFRMRFVLARAVERFENAIPAAAGAACAVAAGVYTFFIRTRGITDHFLMLHEQIRDWSIAMGPLSRLPLVGTASTAGGHTFGPIFYWVLWLIRVTIGPFAGYLPHAGGVGLSVLQSVADIVLCFGIRRVTRSWIFAIATVLIIASSPFDLALSSVIWNPVLAVVFAKVGTGLVLSWGDELTRPRRIALAAIAWFAVQSHSAALPFALALFAWILWTQVRQGGRALVTAVAEAVLVVAILQVPAFFATESIRPTKIAAIVQDQPALRVRDAIRAVNDAVGSIGFSPFDIPQLTLLLLGALAAVLVMVGPFAAVGAMTIVPLAITVCMWSVWQQDYDAYVFLTVVPATLLAVAWTTRLVPDHAARSALALALLVVAALIQGPRRQSATLVFRMSGYGAMVRGTRAIVERGEPIRSIQVDAMHPLTEPEYLFTLMGGRLQPDAPATARIAENGEVRYVR